MGDSTILRGVNFALVVRKILTLVLFELWRCLCASEVTQTPVLLRLRGRLCASVVVYLSCGTFGLLHYCFCLSHCLKFLGACNIVLNETNCFVVFSLRPLSSIYDISLSLSIPDMNLSLSTGLHINHSTQVSYLVV